MIYLFKRILPAIKSLCLLIFMVLQTGKLPAQQYFYMGDVDTAKNIKQYTLYTKDLYPKIDKEIKLYNYFASNDRLFLISVFPSLKEETSWIPVDTVALKDSIVYRSGIEKIFNKAVYYYLKNPYKVKGSIKRNDIIPIISKNGKCWKPTGMCVSENFFLVSGESREIFPNENLVGSIDTTLPMYSIRTYRENMLKANRRDPFSVFNDFTFLAPARAPRDFLSHTSTIKGEKAYHFWTLSDWSVHDGLNLQRGIERFVYIPGKGIVGGSFDFYFAYYNLLPEDLNKCLQQRLNEEVMLAEELKK